MARTSAGALLVVAATVAELAGLERVTALCCGIGPVEAAAATARELERSSPSALLHIGIAGARRLQPATIVLGSESVYCDLGGLTIPVEARALPDAALLAAARRALPRAELAVIATSARIGGGEGYEVEAMEGFAVLRAAARAGVPALELRAVSNAVGEPRASWRVAEALAALSTATATLLEALGA